MPAGIGGPGTGGAGGAGLGGGNPFWDGIRTGWQKARQARAWVKQKKTEYYTSQSERLAEESKFTQAETVSEAQKAVRDKIRDARGTAFAKRTDRALKMAISAGTAGGAITKESVGIYDSPALRKITTENPFLDPNKRQNLTALREASAHTTKDLRQYTAGTESMRGLHETSGLPAKDALMVSGKMKGYNTPPGSMKELNAPEMLVKNRPDFTMQRMNTPIKLNRLRNAGNPGSMSGMPITNPPPQPRLQQAINSSVPVFNLQSLKIRDVEGGETPLARMSTKNLTIRPPIGNTPISGPALSNQSGLSLQAQPRKLLAKPKSSSGFDNSYYKRNMSKFRKELR
jgi:hypothetical protein